MGPADDGLLLSPQPDEHFPTLKRDARDRIRPHTNAAPSISPPHQSRSTSLPSRPMILTTLPAHQRPTMTRLQRRPSAYHSAGESSNSRSRAKHASTTCPAPPSYTSRPSSLNDIALPDYPANPLFANLPSNNDVKAPPIEQEPAQLEAQRPPRQAFQPQAHQARVNRPAGYSSTTCAMLGTLFVLLRASGILVLLAVFVLHVLFNVGGDSASKCRANPGHAGCASYRNSTTNATMFGQ